MPNLKYRFLIIAALCLASVWALVPRTVTLRERGADGVLRDETIRRVPLRRGLDLQGGTYLALEIDDTRPGGNIPDDQKAEAIQRALTTVRTRMEGFGVSETVVQAAGNDRIVVEIPGEQDQERARSLVEQQAYLEFLITDESQSLERVLPRLDQIIREKGGAVASTTTPQTRPRGLEGLLGTSDTTKAAGDTTKRAPGDTAAVAGATDSARADTTIQPGGAFSSLLNAGQMPGQFYVATKDIPALEGYLAMPEVKAALPPGKRVLFGIDSVVQGGQLYKGLYVVEARPMLTGKDLTDARPQQDPMQGTMVTFEVNNVGARRFQNETGRHIGDNMAIVLDGRVQGTPPVIQGAIGRNGQITMGGQSLLAAQDLATVLRAGALPVPLRVAEVRNIGPSLGADSISKGLTAAAIAVVLVIVVMLVYYRFSGVLAVGGLALYVLYTLATLAGFGAVLTLPGLAGFVLSIGIAVDANVLIFERIREELDHGKTVRTAIDEGFRHAMPAIIDSNVSTILTAAVLYQFGTGPVQGFAVTLIAGIVASLISSIFVVRTFYLLWLNRSRGAQTLSI